MLESTLAKASSMLKEKAYLHHFEKFGVDEERFREAFMVCEETLAMYQNL